MYDERSISKQWTSITHTQWGFRVFEQVPREYITQQERGARKRLEVGVAREGKYIESYLVIIELKICSTIFWRKNLFLTPKI